MRRVSLTPESRPEQRQSLGIDCAAAAEPKRRSGSQSGSHSPRSWRHPQGTWAFRPGEVLFEAFGGRLRQQADLPDTEEATSSNLVPPTSTAAIQGRLARPADRAGAIRFPREVLRATAARRGPSDPSRRARPEVRRAEVRQRADHGGVRRLAANLPRPRPRSTRTHQGQLSLRKGTTADRLAEAPGLRPRRDRLGPGRRFCEGMTHDRASAPRVRRQLHGRHVAPVGHRQAAADVCPAR